MQNSEIIQEYKLLFYTIFFFFFKKNNSKHRFYIFYHVYIYYNTVFILIAKNLTINYINGLFLHLIY